MKPRNIVILKLKRIAFDDQLIVRFRDLVFDSVSRDLDLLAKNVKKARGKRKVSDIENQMLASGQEDEVNFLEEVDDLVESLSILALYSMLEIRVKYMCGIAIPGVNRRKLSEFNKLADSLRRAGIDITTLVGYDGFDELRLWNNAIKHAGQAGPELTKYGWTVGDSTKAIAASYPRFQEACTDFVESLRDALIGIQP